jgi:predicted nucleic acid-binding Zn ribbon protein
LLRGVAFDERGCRVDAAPELTIEGDAALVEKCRLDGARFTVAEDAPAGAVVVVARLRGQRFEASIEITPPHEYAELLARRGLDARGEDDHAVVATIAAEVGSTSTTSVDRGVERRNTILVIGGGVAAIFAIAALGLIVRGRRRVEADEQSPEREESAQPPTVAFFEATGGAMACAKCGAAFPPGTAFCSVDGTPLVPGESSTSAPQPERVSVAPISVRQGSADKPGKVCATCGELYPLTATFCGADGTELMPING